MVRARSHTLPAVVLGISVGTSGLGWTSGDHPLVLRFKHTEAVTPAVESRQIPTVLPAQHLPIVREHRYRMAGKVRLVLFWIGREEVGSGVITWRQRGDERAFELLIGSDPELAPGHLNKWGYLIEHNHGVDSSLVGLISQNHEDRLSDVLTAINDPEPQRAFDTIRGHVASSEAFARVGTLYADPHLTARDADAVLSRVLANTSLPLKRIARSPDVRAGFLTAISELIAVSLERAGTDRQAARARVMKPIRYVHGDRLYELRTLESARLARLSHAGRTFDNVVRARFETQQVGAPSGTRFDLVYGAEGEMAGVPIVISYQPKWWLHIDLVLQT